MMDIETLRWAPLSGSCAISPGGFGWSHPLPSTLHPWWEDVMEKEDGQFLFDAEYKGGWIAGTWLRKSCTDLSSYPTSWKLFSGPPGDVGDVSPYAFRTSSEDPNPKGKPGRILDLDVFYEHNELRLSVVFVPNYGSAAKAWWWGYGATAADLGQVLAGKAWQAFKADGIKKKIVAIDRQADGKFSFVLNEHKQGEAWWWGFGAPYEGIVDVINGKAWASFTADKVLKRLVSLKRHGQNNWTFLAVPADGVAWWWWTNLTWNAISAEAQKNNARVIDLERYGSSEDQFSAVLVQNK